LELHLLEWLGPDPRAVGQRVRVVLADLGVEAGVLDRGERRGQEVGELLGPLEAELCGDRRAEDDVRAQAGDGDAGVSAFGRGAPARDSRGSGL
jgi:hypothetical protein